MFAGGGRVWKGFGSGVFCEKIFFSSLIFRLLFFGGRGEDTFDNFDLLFLVPSQESACPMKRMTEANFNRELNHGKSTDSPLPCNPISNTST